MNKLCCVFFLCIAVQATMLGIQKTVSMTCKQLLPLKLHSANLLGQVRCASMCHAAEHKRYQCLSGNQKERLAHVGTASLFGSLICGYYWYTKFHMTSINQRHFASFFKS